MKSYPIHMIVVDDKRPHEVLLIDYDSDGNQTLSRIVGRKKAQRLLFENAVAGNIIHSEPISVEGGNGTKIAIIDKLSFEKVHNEWLAKNNLEATP